MCSLDMCSDYDRTLGDLLLESWQMQSPDRFGRERMYKDTQSILRALTDFIEVECKKMGMCRPSSIQPPEPVSRHFL